MSAARTDHVLLTSNLRAACEVKVSNFNSTLINSSVNFQNKIDCLEND